MRHFFEFSRTSSPTLAGMGRMPIDGRAVVRPSSVAALALGSALLCPAPFPEADAAEIGPARTKQSTGEAAPKVLLAQSEAEPQEEPADLSLRYGRHEEYDRFAFEWPEPVEVDFSESGGELVLTFDRGGEVKVPPESDFTYLADSTLPQLVFGMRAEDGGRRYRVDIDRNARFRIHRWNDGHLIVLDVFQPTPADEPGAAAALDTEPESETPAPEVEPQPVVPVEAPEVPPVDEPAEAEPSIEDEPEAVEEEIAEEDEESETVEDDESHEDDDEPYEDEEEDEEDERSYGFVTSGPFTVDLAGSLQFGVSTASGDRLSDDGDPGYAFFTDADVSIDAYTTFLDEVDVGASLSLEAGVDDGANADEVYIYLDDGFGQVQIGRTSGAEDDMALGADTIAAGTGGIDGDTANLGDTQVETSGDAAKVSYFTPRISGFQAGVSYTPDTGDDETDDDDGGDFENYVGFGLNYVETYGGAELGLAAVSSLSESEAARGDALSAFAVGGTLEFDALAFGASYGRSASDIDFDYDFATAGVTYGFDEASAGIGYNYVDEKSDGVTHVFVLSGDMPILPGVALQGDVSFADPDNDDGNVASVLAVELSY